MKRHTFATALLAAAIFAGASYAEDIPAGWRTPRAREIADSDRKDSSTRYVKAVGDFNGDGVPDEALLLKSTRFSGEALWVRVSNVEGKFDWIKLAEIKWGKDYPSVNVAMGIESVPPGVHPYGCFEDAKDCNFGPHKDRPKLRLRDPSLMYFKFGSAASLYFWSSKYNKFVRVWLSD
jgi:hypothetical protein